jgi:hypothetical protein
MNLFVVEISISRDLAGHWKKAFCPLQGGHGVWNPAQLLTFDNLP